MALRMKAATAQIAKGSHEGLIDAGDHILGVARENCPIDEGTLRRSGRATTRQSRAFVSFGGPELGDYDYAEIQHERLDYDHPGGGGPKYLERAILSERAVAKALIAAQLRRALA